MSAIVQPASRHAVFIWPVWLQPISPKVRKFEGSQVRRLEKKVLESERKGSVVRRSRIPKS